MVQGGKVQRLGPQAFAGGFLSGDAGACGGC